MPYHILALVGCLFVTTCCFGQVDGKRQPAPTSTQDTTSGNPEKPKRQKQVVTAAVQPCEDCPGPPGPCWLTCEQKTPIARQVKVFVNVCSGERYIVWPLAKGGETPVRKRERVKPGETVLVELIHVNPNAWNEVVFSDSSTISTTPEPGGFVFGNTPKPAAEKTDAKPKDAEQPPAAFAPDGKFTPLATIKAKIDEVKGEAGTIRQRIEANDAQLNKLGNLLRELQRADKLMSSDPCFSADQLLRIQTPLREQVRSFVGEGVNLSDSEALTKSLLGQITSYTATQDSLDKAATVLIETDWKEDIQTLSDLIEKKPTGRPATTIKTVKAGSSKPRRGAARAVQPSAAAEVDTIKPVDLLQGISSVQMDLAELSRKVTEAGCRVDLLKKEQVPDLQKRIAALSQSFAKGQSLSARRYIMPGRTVSSMAESVTVRARGIRPDPKDAQKVVSSPFLNLTLPVVGGFELAFSTGLAVSNLIDYQYTVQTGDTITTPASGTVAATIAARSTILRDSSKIGALLTTNLHGIWSVTPVLSVGFHFGIGLDIVNGQRARYMGGVSLKFGGISDNLLLNFGVITGQVKRLSASRVLNKTYEERIDSGAIPTYDKSDLGFYIGASYILFSKKIKKGL